MCDKLHSKLKKIVFFLSLLSIGKEKEKTLPAKQGFFFSSPKSRKPMRAFRKVTMASDDFLCLGFIFTFSFGLLFKIPKKIQPREQENLWWSVIRGELIYILSVKVGFDCKLNKSGAQVDKCTRVGSHRVDVVARPGAPSHHRLCRIWALSSACYPISPSAFSDIDWSFYNFPFLSQKILIFSRSKCASFDI